MNDFSIPITQARGFLKEQLNESRYSLRCLNQHGEKKYSDGKGHLFSLFFMTRALAGTLKEVERSIVLTRIISEAMGNEWGYSPRGYYKELSHNPFFVDADDTAFALRVFRKLEIYRPPEILHGYIVDWDKGGGAFVTFKNNQTTCSIATEPAFENNFQLHAEVNANVFHALLDSKWDDLISGDFIKATQHADGAWRGYFYPGPYYATWQFMHLLRNWHKSHFEEYKKGMQFIVSTQNENGSWGDGNPYHTALALSVLALSPYHEEKKQRAVEYLVSKQRKNGSWEYNDTIWQFPDREGEMWLATDNYRVITTSVCVEALVQVMGKEEE